MTITHRHIPFATEPTIGIDNSILLVECQIVLPREVIEFQAIVSRLIELNGRRFGRVVIVKDPRNRLRWKVGLRQMPRFARSLIQVSSAFHPSKVLALFVLILLEGHDLLGDYFAVGYFGQELGEFVLDIVRYLRGYSAPEIEKVLIGCNSLEFCHLFFFFYRTNVNVNK